MPSDFENIVALVKEFTARDTIKLEDKIVTDLNIDSLTLLFLVTRIEEEYHIEISHIEINSKNFSTVERIIFFIEEKQREKNDEPNNN
jgi:acyl carrier protein